MIDYQGYEKAKRMTQKELFSVVSDASLLEFGTDKTPVSEKWELTRKKETLIKASPCLVCGLNNADSDHTLLNILKENPEKVLDGMSIAALAVNAGEKWLYLPEGETDYAADLQKTADLFDVKIQTGMIDVRKYPCSVIHHIETMAALSELLTETYEPATYMAVKIVDGKSSDPIPGKLRRIHYGTCVSSILKEEMIDTADIYAVMIGPQLMDISALDMIIEPDTPIGNGVITIFYEACCIIQEAEKLLLDLRRQSCGKCTFCREGLFQLHAMTREIAEGKGKKEYPDLIQEIGTAMTFSTCCSLGQTAPLYSLGSLRCFSSEYADHIQKKTCRCGACKAFLNIYIDPRTCTGCEECLDVCPTDAIEGKSGFIHMIDDYECIKCGKCIDICDENAIIQTSNRLPKLPMRLTKVGKFKKR